MNYLKFIKICIEVLEGYRLDIEDREGEMKYGLIILIIEVMFLNLKQKFHYDLFILSKLFLRKHYDVFVF